MFCALNPFIVNPRTTDKRRRGFLPNFTIKFNYATNVEFGAINA